MFLLLGDGEYLALGDGPPARLLLGEDFPNGWIDTTGPIKVSSNHLELVSDDSPIGLSNSSPQGVQ
jgi:hypothetical protein